MPRHVILLAIPGTYALYHLCICDARSSYIVPNYHASADPRLAAATFVCNQWLRPSEPNSSRLSHVSSSLGSVADTGNDSQYSRLEVLRPQAASLHQLTDKIKHSIPFVGGGSGSSAGGKRHNHASEAGTPEATPDLGRKSQQPCGRFRVT